MSFELAVLLADRIGVFVFALSGGTAAVRKDMDLFGAIVLALLPAAGGGTLRDLLLGVPVFWLEDPSVLWLAAAGGLVAFAGHRLVEAFKPLIWADALGLSLFAATGAAKAFGLGHGLSIVVVMGTLTAAAGGLLRDTVANREPLLLQEDVYATAAFFGSATYFGLATLGLDERAAFLASAGAAFGLRALAISLKLSLPKPRR
ncbi:trimeric intracellular cation channel family protein [Parvularcula dongshanensis]|uniref:Putative membrane protein YeiH n=1 Tax=Parvularcula dongshanensis TaxID=1173995 RepID=A0A840HY82_9PROT|nr:trimeric intracellular cation channel family protein [Parvularcula dongshanensis]MBB4657529.1 putative membrane protein YeiH [Parvularcula dongshanensis]